MNHDRPTRQEKESRYDVADREADRLKADRVPWPIGNGISYGKEDTATTYTLAVEGPPGRVHAVEMLDGAALIDDLSDRSYVGTSWNGSSSGEYQFRLYPPQPRRPTMRITLLGRAHEVTVPIAFDKIEIPQNRPTLPETRKPTRVSDDEPGERRTVRPTWVRIDVGESVAMSLSSSAAQRPAATLVAELQRYAAYVPRPVRRGLLYVVAAYVLFLTACCVWLSYSPTAEHLHQSIGKQAELRDAGGNVYRGTLVAADVVPESGRGRFLVRIMEIGADSRTPRMTIGYTLDVWQLGNVKIVE